MIDSVVNLQFFIINAGQKTDKITDFGFPYGLN